MRTLSSPPVLSPPIAASNIQQPCLPEYKIYILGVRKICSYSSLGQNSEMLYEMADKSCENIVIKGIFSTVEKKTAGKTDACEQPLFQKLYKRLIFFTRCTIKRCPC